MVEKKCKALIVDSDKDSVKILSDILSPYFKVITTESPIEALVILKNNLIDIVISEYDLKEMNGIQFLQTCYQLNHLNTRLLVTGKVSFEILIDALNSGNIYGYIKKPFLKSEILPIITDAIKENELKKENNTLIYDLKTLLRGTINSIVSALDAKDSFTHGRSHRVKILALKIADKFNLSLKEKGELELAGLLHDIGMIGVPEEILHKQTPLSEEEFNIVKEHVSLSVKILLSIKQLEGVTKIIKSHHERFNGRGYPEGLAGDEIPLGSRIIALADAYDSMVSKRSYRESLSHEEAIYRIEEQRGHQFDPIVIDAFKDVVLDALVEIRQYEYENGKH